MRNVLILSTSPRKNSNSEALAEAFAKGAKKAGHQVQTIRLREKTLAFCRGCMTCKTAGRCAEKDDAGEILQDIKNADVVVFATPIYFYGMSGQMKTLLDRSCCIYGSDCAFSDVYLLSAATDSNPAAEEGAVLGLNGWISCFEKAKLSGTVFAGGVTNPLDIVGHPALEKAFNMGKTIS